MKCLVYSRIGKPGSNTIVEQGQAILTGQHTIMTGHQNFLLCRVIHAPFISVVSLTYYKMLNDDFLQT